MVKYTEEQTLELIMNQYKGKKTYLLAPLVRNRKGHYKELFEQMRKKGYLNVRVVGEMKEIFHGMKLDRYKMHSIEVVVDKLIVSESDERRLKESLRVAMKQGDGLVLVLDAETDEVRHFSRRTGTGQFVGHEQDRARCVAQYLQWRYRGVGKI